VSAARDAGWPLQAVFALEGDTTVADDAVRVTPEVMRHLAPTVHPRGPVAVVDMPSSHPVERSCLVAYEVSDPGNLGTLIRAAAAFGLDVAVTTNTTDPWSPKTLRSGAGSHFTTAIELNATVRGLSRRGYTTVAAVPRGGVDPHELHRIDTVAIVVGSEAHGLPEDLAVDMSVTIPIGIESLNAGVAGAILAYEYARGSRDRSTLR
jgi:RNA methyltransferase, TrmH family